jgi:hypothetical protein
MGEITFCPPYDWRETGVHMAACRVFVEITTIIQLSFLYCGLARGYTDHCVAFVIRL